MSEQGLSKIFFPVSHDREIYNVIRLKYQKLAEVAQHDFQTNYNSNFNNIDDIHNNADQLAQNYLMKAIDEAIRDLIQYNIKDIDEDEFYNTYIVDADNNPWPEYFSQIDDKYLEILLNDEELDNYRNARKENRGRIIGGGFGFKGAVKGMAGAAAANIAIGAAHSLFNVAAKSASAADSAWKKSKLFDNPDTRATLVYAIYLMIFAVHDALIEAINERIPDKITGHRKEDECDKAKKLFVNVQKGRITGNDAKLSLIEALSLDPYNEEIYQYWIKQYDDADGLVGDAAQYFGLQFIVNEKKKLINDKKKVLDFTTPESCQSSLKALDAYATTIGYNDIEVERTEITALADKLEKKQRTFKGVTYDTILSMQEAMLSAKARDKKTNLLITKSIAVIAVVMVIFVGITLFTRDNKKTEHASQTDIIAKEKADAGTHIPYLTGRVVDNANILSAETQKSITERLKAHENRTSNQIAVLTTATLRGQSIEEYAVAVFKEWKLGQKDKDNGILVIVAPNDRRMRIEVGYGLASRMPDSVSGNIIRNIMAPRFKSGDYNSGIDAGVQAIISALEGDI